MASTKAQTLNDSQLRVLVALSEEGATVDLWRKSDNSHVQRQLGGPESIWEYTGITVNGRSAQALADRGYLEPVDRPESRWKPTRFKIGDKGLALLTAQPAGSVAAIRQYFRDQLAEKAQADALLPYRGDIRRSEENAKSAAEAVIREIRAAGYNRSAQNVIVAVNQLAHADGVLEGAKIAFKEVLNRPLESFLADNTAQAKQ